jgi:hypothetical protein
MVYPVFTVHSLSFRTQIPGGVGQGGSWLIRRLPGLLDQLVADSALRGLSLLRIERQCNANRSEITRKSGGQVQRSPKTTVTVRIGYRMGYGLGNSSVRQGLYVYIHISYCCCMHSDVLGVC